MMMMMMMIILISFTTKGSCTWNITHNTGSSAVRKLKPERWGSPSVQEKYHGDQTCDNIIIIIIIIIIQGANVMRN